MAILTEAVTKGMKYGVAHSANFQQVSDSGNVLFSHFKKDFQKLMINNVVLGEW